jgi:hypothetical protein
MCKDTNAPITFFLVEEDWEPSGALFSGLWNYFGCTEKNEWNLWGDTEVGNEVSCWYSSYCSLFLKHPMPTLNSFVVPVDSANQYSFICNSLS